MPSVILCVSVFMVFHTVDVVTARGFTHP